MIKQKNAIISSFSRIIEERDAYTNSHLDNVAGLSVQIAMELGFNEEQLDQIWVAGKLHDIGKIHTPHEILNKPSRLTKEEFEVIKEHASHSYDLLKEFDFGFPLADIVGQHHERLDGSGYPNGIKGNEIMREAQIIAVADIADAMLSNRPYRNGLPKDIVLAELNRIRGIHYDEIIIDTTIDIISRRERY
jgi:putative nucleotidyltransferase with HDIG domain